MNLRGSVLLIVAELRSALVQWLPSDDDILREHVETALAEAESVLRDGFKPPEVVR